MLTTESSILPSIVPLVAVGLFLCMLALMELGRRAGKQRASEPGARDGLGAVEGAVFALMGLVIAFTFSGAASRFDGRRQMVVEETNAIGTAWLRLDALPAASQPFLRDQFRSYVDARLAIYAALPDLDAALARLAAANELQSAIWARAVEVCASPEGQRATMLLLPALNAMFDVAAVRTMAAQTHPPGVVFAMLFMLALASSLLAGHGMAGSETRSWMHMLGFAAIMALTVYSIIDLEYPRMGLIRVDAADQLLVELRGGMG